MASDEGNGKRGNKSASAFRTISEVSDSLEVAPHVLRFWESKFNQVRPLKRGGGRRYYRPEDVALLLRIRELLYSEGYTIKGVQKLLRQRSAKAREAEGTAETETSEAVEAQVTDSLAEAPASEAAEPPAQADLLGGLEQPAGERTGGGVGAGARNRLLGALNELKAAQQLLHKALA